MDEPERIYREQGLRDAVLAGDERAWRYWYEQCQEPLHRYVLWRCGGLRSDADEISQETWLIAVRRLESFDPFTGSFLGWLRGIASGLLRNHIRRVRRDRQPLQPAERSAESPDGELLRLEQAHQVAYALACLPENYEAVLRGKYLEERSVAEIARERGESIKAIESQLTRAREAFRAAFQIEG